MSGRSAARAVDVVWVGVPLALRRVSSGLATAASDGLYLAVRPAVGLVAALSGLLAGFAAGALHVGFTAVFTEALWLLLLIAVAGAASGAVGLYLTVGFVLGDLFVAHNPLWMDYTPGVAKYGSWLVSYLMLAMLAVVTPIAAKSLAAELRLPATTPASLRAVMGLGTMVAMTGLLVLVWLRSAPLLIRPVFTWAGQAPSIEAVSVPREHETWIVATAVVAAAGRAVAQLILATRWSRLADLEGRFRDADPVRPLWGRLPLSVRLVLRAALVTVVLSGLYEAWWHALLTFVALVAAQFVASMLGLRGLAWHGALIGRVPRLVRLAVVLVPVYLLGLVVLGFYLSQSTRSFVPFLTLAIISAVLMSLLHPALPRSEGETR